MDQDIRVLIVEDETIIAARIALELNELGYEVAGIITRGEQVLAHCLENLPDLILLDISLKGELDGIAVAELLQEKMEIPIIFLTANTDEATFNRAKQTRPYAFISKPYKKLDLQRAIELTISRLSAAVPELEVQEESDEASSYILSDRIFVRHNNQMVKLFLNEILYLEAERSYCRIFTKDAEYLLSIPLRNLEAQLPAASFVRVHRSFVVNLQKIDTISEYYEFLTIQEKQIPIARRLKEEVIKRLKVI